MKRSRRHTHPRLWAREYARYYHYLEAGFDLLKTALAGCFLAGLLYLLFIMIFGYGT